VLRRQESLSYMGTYGLATRDRVCKPTGEGRGRKVRKLMGWWSKHTESVALDMDGQIAAKLDNWLAVERGKPNLLLPPVVIQLHDAIKHALSQCPAEKR
jgi:hypothetical protein